MDQLVDLLEIGGDLKPLEICFLLSPCGVVFVDFRSGKAGSDRLECIIIFCLCLKVNARILILHRNG